MPTVQLGDDDKMFSEAGGQISTRNSYAARRRGVAGGGEIAYRVQPVSRLAVVLRLGDDQPALAEVFEMGEGREARGAGQRGIDPRVDLGDEGGNCLRAV